MTEFTERVQALVSKINEVGASLKSEEATKNALIMPFLHQVLGYDIFNPLEVVPEFTADTPGKKNERVDYAILKDGAVQILIECKKFGETLSVKHASQLFRYFSVTAARIGVLCNGCVYQFFTDLDQPNKMDEVPFLELDLRALDKSLLAEVKKLSKASFNIDEVVGAAGELKYLSQLKQTLAAQFTTPDEDFVRLMTSKVYTGVQTPKIKAQFAVLVHKALKQFLNDSVNARLQSAITDADAADEATAAPEPTSVIDTTQLELDAFYVVRAILRKRFGVDRIVQRDTQSYFGVLLDDNNRKPLCRLHFNTAQKYLGIINQDKTETRVPIESIDDIYNHADALIASVAHYD